MGTGQMMLTLAAFVLLGAVILTVNTGLMQVNTTMNNSRVDIMAVSLGNSIMEDATGLAFDEKTSAAIVNSTIELTAPSSLGLDGSENRNNPIGFDDFDDYNCYRTNAKLDTVIVPGTTKKFIFNTFCAVDYIDPNNPDNISTVKTYHKRLKLRVFTPGMDDTVRLSTVYSYWYFR
jgi:MSHA pilin protein MshD